MKNKKAKKLLISFLHWYDEELNSEELKSSVYDFLKSEKKIKISELLSVSQYLRKLKNTAKEEGNKDKVAAYEISIANIENAIL
jgi:hypothetical protein